MALWEWYAEDVGVEPKSELGCLRTIGVEAIWDNVTRLRFFNTHPRAWDTGAVPSIETERVHPYNVRPLLNT